MKRHDLVALGLCACWSCFDFTPVTFGGPGDACDTRDRACRDGFACSADGICVNDCVGCGALIAGDACAANADCRSSFCVEGLCCDVACDGICRSCSSVRTGSNDGVCSDVLDTASPSPACGGPACDGSGHCKGVRGAFCSNATQCDSGHCYDGVCCNAECSGLCEACSESLTSNSNGFCLPTIAGQKRNGECIGPVACDGDGACFAKTLGSSCANGYECTSGNCVDSTCCDSACDGTCESCGSSGLCAPVVAVEDAGTCDNRVGCARPPCRCDDNSTCGGVSGVSCTQGTECSSGACVDGVCCNTTCAGACRSCLASDTGGSTGTCGDIVGDPYGECPVLDGYDTVCVAGACQGIPNGRACTTSGNCASGHCVDGVCCNTNCTETCRSCRGADTNGSDGVCRSIVGDPYNECPVINGYDTTCVSNGCSRLPNGTQCSADDQCASGICTRVDASTSVCCRTDCELQRCGNCLQRYTSFSYPDGECITTSRGIDPLDQCPGNQVCAGNGACMNP